MWLAAWLLASVLAVLLWGANARRLARHHDDCYADALDMGRRWRGDLLTPNRGDTA
jgi:hypothetical protein